jgi:hypothetical protein
MHYKQYKIINRLMFFAVLLLCSFIYSCDSPTHIYIDIKKQAIVTCDGAGLKEIEIESDFDEVTLEGTDPIIYLNKKNEVSRTSIYDKTVDNFILKLRPNCTYTVTKHNGSDRGNTKLEFETDASGKIVKASDVNCN